MKSKRKQSGESILTELRQQSEEINLSSEDGLEQIHLDEGGDQLNEQAVIGDANAEATAAGLSRNKNEPLLVNVKDTSTGEIIARKMTATQVWALKKSEKVVMELDANRQGKDNGSNLFVRFLGQIARRSNFCPVPIKRWDEVPVDHQKKQWELIEEHFEFDYPAGVKWAVSTLGDRWRAYKYNLRNQYFYPNKRKQEILEANPLDIPLVEWLAFVNHYMDLKTKKQCLQNARNREKLVVSHAGGSQSNVRRANQLEKQLGRPVCGSEVIVSTLLKKDGSYVSVQGQLLAEKISEHLPQDQERAATKGVCSKVLAHPDDAIGKVHGPENGKRVRGFSNVVCPSGFGKSKRIFGAANCGGSSSVSQQHVADLERQLQKVKDQVATFHNFLLQKYVDEVPTFSNDVPHT